ncbi:MAG: hypothetical protein ILO34_02530, partial [Kiritimatiellae bacterium]|nr:hypothetical protein [Kiritimatiellia bacterium]
IGGESFGGSFEYDRRGGRAVLTSGGGGYRWYDILGLDSIEEKRVEFELSGRDLALAQERNPAAGAEKARKMSFAVPDSEELKHVAHWNSGDWRINLFARRNAEGRFRIGFGVEEPSPWTNNGTDRYEMFKSGDCVDFQYLDGNGEACRLMAYPPGGIVLYRHNAKGDAHVFASPWRSYTVGDVSFPENLDLRVAKGERDYRVEFDVPGDFSGDRELKCDFGVIFGDRDGRVNMSRVYWSNKETGLVNDVPGEIMPEPEKWGVIRFGAGAKKVAGPVASARAVRAGPVVNPHGTVCEDDGTAYHRENYAAGPAYDRKNKLVYVSGGKGVVRALTLDGEEVSRYRLPSARAFDRFDSLVFDDRSGELFALVGGLAAQDKRKNEPDAGMLYRIRPKTGEVSLVASNLCAISGKALGGRIAAMTQDSTLDWIDLKTMARSPLSSDSVENGSVYPCMIDFLPDRTPIAFVQHNWYYLYRNGRRSEPRTVFGDREISMTRGAVIGDELWLLAGATIKRYGATDMKCAPGVVYGGASGYFLGHVEMDEGMHAVGICALDEPGVYAVASAVNSAVCVMRYDDANWRMVPLKRLGGICKPANLLVDDDGMMMADSLCWRWDSPPNSPTALTVVRMPVRASVVAKDGKTVHITETHGSRIEFRHGRLADGELAFDWNRDSLPYPEGFNPSEGQRWGEKAPVCAFEKDGVVFALSADGFVRTYAIDGEGHPAGEGYFAERRLPRPPWQGGDFSSFAPLADGSFAVQVGGRAYRYAFGGGEWKAGERLGALDGCYVVADGGLVAVAAGAAGEVRLFADGDQFRELCRIDALAAPRRLAMRNGRLVVWEAAAQRISSYEIETESM